MARMSASKRIELGNQMLHRWLEAGCEDDRSVLFVRDMITRLSRGKSMSPKQREWFDKATLTNPPEPQNEELVIRLRDAAQLAGMEKVSSVLSDFSYKLSKGWSLSQKQAVFMNKLLAKADDIRTNGVWSPTQEQKASIEVGVAFSQRYTHYYLSGCPGLSKAINECRSWLNGDIENLDEWSANKVITLCQGDRKVMADAKDRWPVGSLVETKKGKLGLILSEPHVGTSSGKPAISLLVDGNPTVELISDIKKKRRKKCA